MNAGLQPRTLERIRDPDPAAFSERYLRPRQPVIIAGALDAWPAQYRSLAGLASRCGDLAVEVDEMGGDAFVFDSRRRTVTTRMRLEDFVAGGRLATGYVQCRGDQVTRLLDVSSTTLSFAPRTLRRIETIWIGGGAGYGLHHDIGTDQFLCQLVGRKRVLLIADCLRNTAVLRLEPLHSGRFYRSTVAGALTDREAEPPALVGLERFVDTLAPGEVLYIPCAWFHELRPLEPGISIGHRHFLATRFAASVVASLARHVVSSTMARRRHA